MNNKQINIIAAVDKEFGLSKLGNIPWKIKEDLKFFKDTTLNCVVIMGKNTYLSLNKPLKDRVNIVVSSTLKDEKVTIVKSLKNAIEINKEEKTIFIIGGSKLYQEALKTLKINTIYLTVIDDIYNCDTFFPTISLASERSSLAGETIEDRFTNTKKLFDDEIIDIKNNKKNKMIIYEIKN